jgi:hypothetical protein
LDALGADDVALAVGERDRLIKCREGLVGLTCLSEDRREIDQAVAALGDVV